MVQRYGRNQQRVQKIRRGRGSEEKVVKERELVKKTESRLLIRQLGPLSLSSQSQPEHNPSPCFDSHFSFFVFFVLPRLVRWSLDSSGGSVKDNERLGHESRLSLFVLRILFLDSASFKGIRHAWDT